MKPSEYTWADILAKVLFVMFVLAIFAIIFITIYRIAQAVRVNGHVEDPDYEEVEMEKSSFGRFGKKSRRKYARTNNERVRDIFREYLLFIQRQGVIISDQTTSEEALIASKELFDTEEADALRALYIRARYNDDLQLTNEEVRRAKELWKTIRKEYEATQN